MGRKEASVTVPLCLALPVLAVFLFALLESVRYDGLSADAKERTELAAESLFTEYQPVLFEKFQIFMLDGGYGEGACDISRLQDELEAFAGGAEWRADKKEGINLYRLLADGAEIFNYRLATDENGKAFIAQAACAMKQTLSVQAAKKIKERICGVRDGSVEGGNSEDKIAGASGTLAELKKEADGAGDGDSAPPIEAPAQQNPLELIKKLRKQGILALTLPKGKTVSDKKISVENCLLKRDCAKGNFKLQKSPGWYERILMQEWIKPFAGNAAAPNKGGALSYGTEYIICGRDSDLENLKRVVKKILLLREGMNFLYLKQDAIKQGEAMEAACAIAGATANPAVIAAVKEGILAAWAYAESICDVKALLAGGRIPALKNAACWQTALSNLGAAVSGEYRGEASGMSYGQYLDVLLYALSAKQAAYRSMDLMELYVKSKKGYEACRMDAMLVGIKARVSYRADALFSGLFGMGGTGGYSFLEEAAYVYE